MPQKVQRMTSAALQALGLQGTKAVEGLLFRDAQRIPGTQGQHRVLAETTVSPSPRLIDYWLNEMPVPEGLIRNSTIDTAVRDAALTSAVERFAATDGRERDRQKIAFVTVQALATALPALSAQHPAIRSLIQYVVSEKDRRFMNDNRHIRIIVKALAEHPGLTGEDLLAIAGAQPKPDVAFVWLGNHPHATPELRQVFASRDYCSHLSTGTLDSISRHPEGPLWTPMGDVLVALPTATRLLAHSAAARQVLQWGIQQDRIALRSSKGKRFVLDAYYKEQPKWLDKALLALLRTTPGPDLEAVVAALRSTPPQGPRFRWKREEIDQKIAEVLLSRPTNTVPLSVASQMVQSENGQIRMQGVLLAGRTYDPDTAPRPAVRFRNP